MRTIATTLALTLLLTADLYAAAATDDDGEAESVIDQVMQETMTSGLAKRVAGKSADKEDKELLLKLFRELEETDPPVGDKDEWDERVKKLVDAAQDAIDDKDGYQRRLKKAVNCGACHKAHRSR